jgi:hypothetical protein
MADESTNALLSLILQGQAAKQQPQTALAFQPYSIDGRVYKNTALNLDGYTFSNCVFIECELTTSKANFHIRDCHFQSCRIVFSGNALRAAKLCSLLMGNWDHLPEALRAKVEPDWGLTIE